MLLEFKVITKDRHNYLECLINFSVLVYVQTRVACRLIKKEIRMGSQKAWRMSQSPVE